MARHTDADADESLTTAEDFADLSTGDTVTVEYEKNRGNGTKTFDAEVRGVDVSKAYGSDDLFGWVDVDLCRTVDESGDDLADDDFARRRVSVDPGDSVDVESRATTRNGAEYRRISAIAGTVDVVLSDR